MRSRLMQKRRTDCPCPQLHPAPPPPPTGEGGDVLLRALVHGLGHGQLLGEEHPQEPRRNVVQALHVPRARAPEGPARCDDPGCVRSPGPRQAQSTGWGGTPLPHRRKSRRRRHVCIRAQWKTLISGAVRGASIDTCFHVATSSAVRCGSRDREAGCVSRIYHDSCAAGCAGPARARHLGVRDALHEGRDQVLILAALLCQHRVLPVTVRRGVPQENAPALRPQLCRRKWHRLDIT